MRLPRPPPVKRETVKRNAGVAMLGFAICELLHALAQLLEALRWWT